MIEVQESSHQRPPYAITDLMAHVKMGLRWYSSGYCISVSLPLLETLLYPLILSKCWFITLLPFIYSSCNDINGPRLSSCDVYHKNWIDPVFCTKVQLKQEDLKFRGREAIQVRLLWPSAILLLFPRKDLINARILSFMGPHSAGANFRRTLVYMNPCSTSV